MLAVSHGDGVGKSSKPEFQLKHLPERMLVRSPEEDARKAERRLEKGRMDIG